MTAYAFFGEFEINDSNDSIVVDSNSVSLTQQSLYIYHPTASYSLLDYLCTVISAYSTSAVNYSISTSGKVTLTSADTFLFGWDDLEVLGFTSTQYSGQNAYTAESYLKYCWFPEKNVSDLLTPIARQGIKYAISPQVETIDSTVSTWLHGTLIKQEMLFSYISSAKTWNASNDNSSYEEFWEDVLQQGTKFLCVPYYPTNTTYFAYKANLETNDMKELKPTRQIKGADTYWNIKMNLLGQT